jgi:hypothetical protein
MAALAMLTLALTTVSLCWMVCQSHRDKEDRLGAEAPVGDLIALSPIATKPDPGVALLMGKANGTFSLLSGLSIATPLSFFVKVADVAFVTIESSR